MRAAIVAEARTWLGTPWHHEARLKGVGVDCAQLLIGVFAAVGAIAEFATDHYPADWAFHRGDQRFLEILKRYADVVSDARPGDVAMFEFGRADAHGSIVVEWPTIIHAYAKTKTVQLDDAVRNVQLAERLAGFYRLKVFAK